MMTNPEYVYFAQEDYVKVKAGEPFRLLPLRTIYKQGKPRDVRAMAGYFKLPPWDPAIKLGSHKESAPAGGHIKRIEVREDGIYAIPEFTEKGLRAMKDGDFKYQSPEVIWDDGFIEDDKTGNKIAGPFIVGAALHHMPHLGQDAALYSVGALDSDGGATVTEMVTAPASLWDKAFSFLGKAEPNPPAEPEPTPVDISGVEPEKFEALEQERNDLQAQLQQMEVEKQQAERVAYFAAEFKETVLDDSAELHGLLADIRDEPTAEALLVQFKALSGQIVESNLTSDIGSSGEEDLAPGEALNKAVLAKMEEAKVDYNAAMILVLGTNPELGEDFRIGG
jgi:hypothetical protein